MNEPGSLFPLLFLLAGPTDGVTVPLGGLVYGLFLHWSWVAWVLCFHWIMDQAMSPTRIMYRGRMAISISPLCLFSFHFLYLLEAGLYILPSSILIPRIRLHPTLVEPRTIVRPIRLGLDVMGDQIHSGESS